VLRRGENVYNFEVQRSAYLEHTGFAAPWAHFYPPSASVVALPTTLVSYSIARELWFVGVLSVMYYGLWRFLTAFFVRWTVGLKILILGLVTCAAATRWSMWAAQPGPVILGLFALFLVELRDERRTWQAVAIGAIAVSVKVTFGLPFVLIALARRRVWLVVAMGGCWAALNLIGLVGMGGPAIVEDYRANMAEFDRPDQVNAPDPRSPDSVARTDWPYLLNALDPELSRNTVIGFALTFVALGWLTREVLRNEGRLANDTGLLALSAPVAALSMLAVYHHHYDMTILLLPVIVYLGTPVLRTTAAWFYVVPVVAYAGFYPYQQVASISERLFGDNSVLITRPLASVTCVVGFLASLVVLRNYLKRAPADAPEPAPA
jgi:hypothetical protein